MNKNNRHFLRPCAALCLATWLAMLAGAAYGESTLPRTEDGKPDMNGIWQTMNEANWHLEGGVARHAAMLREGPHGPLPAAEVLKLGAVIAVPPGPSVIKGGGPIPYKPAAQAKRRQLQANWVHQDPEVKCYLPGVPRATYMPYPMQIFQNPGDIVIAYQFAGAVRDIYFDDPGEAPIDTWMGWSHGRWEGDTLIVEVTGLNPGSWLDRTGTHHSDQMKVTERYTMAGPNRINYEATIEDPEVFEKPWTIQMPLYRRAEPGFVMLEFKCVEFVEELLFGEYRRKPLERP
ncbi:MAG: hypothetical protein O2780_14250 [Proteobacteria bacterium]|nr:hypothetical protein [Pseudomonadota bacterium]MDA1300763.1 hypothetical protein [Pseudomonadota bacterium]